LDFFEYYALFKILQNFCMRETKRKVPKQSPSNTLLVGKKCLHRDYGDDFHLSSPNFSFEGLGGKTKMAQGENLEPYNFRSFRET